MKSSLDDYARYDDEKLISLIAQAREEALAQLYDRYNRMIFSIVLAIVGDQSTAEEITLDVFMRVWQKAGTYRPDRAKVRTWLTHIARHHAIDVLRHRSIRPDHSAISWDGATPGTIPFAQDPQDLVELSMRQERIHTALEQLPENQKQVLTLTYFGGMTQLEIAEALKQPLGTIKTRIRLAMQKLCDLLKDEQEPEDKSKEAIAAYNMTREDS